MAAVSEMIVREFFESRGFFVRQGRKHVNPNKVEEDSADFHVLHPIPETGTYPFLLRAGDVACLGQAVVAVKGWYSERFTPSVLRNSPEIYTFAQPSFYKRTLKAFGERGPVARVLVVPGLPADGDEREESVKILRSAGVDAVISFEAMIEDLIGQVEVNRNYAKSDLLQTLRVLKSYSVFRSPQMELFTGAAPGRRSRKRVKKQKNTKPAAVP